MKAVVACLAVVLLTVPLTAQDGADPEWIMDLNRVRTPEHSARGKMLGAAFKVDRATMVATGPLIMKSGKDSLFIILPDKPGRMVEGKTYKVGPDDKDSGLGVHIHVHSIPPAKATAFSTGYSLRLEFDRMKDGKVPAKIYLCLPDKDKSVVAGTFSLEVK